MSLLGGSEAGRRSSGVATKGADAAEGGVGRRERQGLARLEAGGVCVEARGRARWREESSRVWSGGLAECRCRFLKKLIPRWTPVGR